MTENSRKEVAFETWFRASKAAYARLGEALIQFNVRLRDSYLMDEGRTDVILVRCTLTNSGQFRSMLGVIPKEFKYHSPTVFDNGTIYPIYATPEDEIENKPTETAKRIMKEQAARSN